MKGCGSLMHDKGRQRSVANTYARVAHWIAAGGFVRARESRREEPGSKHGLLVSDSELRDRVTRAGSYRGRRGVIRGLESQGVVARHQRIGDRRRTQVDRRARRVSDFDGDAGGEAARFTYADAQPVAAGVGRAVNDTVAVAPAAGLQFSRSMVNLAGVERLPTPPFIDVVTRSPAARSGSRYWAKPSTACR